MELIKQLRVLYWTDTLHVHCIIEVVEYSAYRVTNLYFVIFIHSRFKLIEKLLPLLHC